MFLLTDGKHYAMKNPMREDDYILTTSPVQATKFNLKQARNITTRKGKRFSKFRDFHIVDVDSGVESKQSLNYKGNGGAYIGENNIEIDDSIVDAVLVEAKSILGLAGWSMTQLKTYKELLNSYQSKCDSAESDIKHALQLYEKKHEGKKPQAHKAAKIAYLLNDVRQQREKIKQCLSYIEVMINAITYNYSLEKIKFEISKASFKEYKERTEYYQIALDILE